MVYSGDNLSFLIMKKILNFLLEAHKLKTIPRTGLVWLGVKNPPTVADHTFRTAIAGWLLGQKNNLNAERLIKNAFAHDICEVYSGDLTPFWGVLPKNEAKRKEKLKRWIRLPLEEKAKRDKKEFEMEKQYLLKLIKPLSPSLREEIFSFWFDYKRGRSAEGRFFKQTDKIDSMLEALEHLNKSEYSMVTPWWEEADELIVDPLLSFLLKIIQNKFYHTKAEIDDEILNKKTIVELENILDFLLEIRKLKRMPRKLWVSLGVKDPETVASHIFTLTLMAWIFGREQKTLNMEKLLKMALCHELPSVYTGDLITPYSRVLPKEKKARRKVFEKWPRLSKKEKEKKFSKDYKKEKTALQKLTSKLPEPLNEEIVQLFKEYKTTSTPEARFLNQLNVLAVLLQGLQYQKEDKDLPVDFLWEWAFEKCDNAACFDFMEILKQKFYGRRFFYKVLRFLIPKKEK